MTRSVATVRTVVRTPRWLGAKRIETSKRGHRKDLRICELTSLTHTARRKGVATRSELYRRREKYLCFDRRSPNVLPLFIDM